LHTSRHTSKNSSFSTQDEHLMLLGLEALTDAPNLRYATRSTYEQQEIAWGELATLCHRTGDAVGEIHALVERCQLLNVPFQTVSNAVNRVNALFSEHHFVFDSDEKRIISQRLALVMESRISEGDATDCSRLAWLFVRLGDEGKAQIVVERGLSIEPENDYCKNLAARISSHRL